MTELITFALNFKGMTKILKDIHNRWLYIAAILLFFPAMYINLGLMGFIDDEAIRALVALEMKLSGNYIVPSIHGGYYYSKPPLFNWILILFYNLSGVINEWTSRIPTTLALAGYGYTIYYYFRKHFDTYTAFVNAFVLITCGRILFWDSMLGLIDITYSWVTFTAFMVVFHEFKKGNHLRLFLLSYLLTATGFMLKGFPSILFQGFTLLAWYIYNKQFKKLISWQHVLGGVVFLAIVGGYYLLYFNFNGTDRALGGLAQQSTTRTFIDQGWWNTFAHLFTFPFEMLYHFLPWSLLIIHFIRKDIIKQIQANKFITFNLLIFLVNIIVYWTSPQVYPRYVLMHAPLLFGVFIFLHQTNKDSWQFKTAEILFLVFIGVFSAISFAPFFMKNLQALPFYLLKTLAIIPALLLTGWLFYKNPKKRLLLLAIFLLIARTGFNWFVLPERNKEDKGAIVRSTSVEIGEAYKDKPLYIYNNTRMQPANSFYLTNTRGAIIPYCRDTLPRGAYFILDPSRNDTLDYQKADEIYMRHLDQRYFHVGRFSSSNSTE